jgi:aryl-alcohol dehydrogenase-like predicted oxidoreductase
MKAFCGDPLQPPQKNAADKLTRNKEINYNQAALRYVINSPVKPDTTITGMYNLDHLYLNVDAYYNPSMNDEERVLLKKMKEKARLVAQHYLPERYRFLEKWA